jgi:hypothetical protein
MRYPNTRSTGGEGLFHAKTRNNSEEDCMKKKEADKKRVQKFLARQTKGGAKGWSYSDAPDPRQQGKVDHPMDTVLWSLELGLTSNQPTLRDVEEMTETLGSWA